MARLAPAAVPLLSDVTVTIVKPLYKTEHPETINGSLHDRLVADLYIPVLFCYRLGAGPGHEYPSYTQMVNRVKDSLQKVLVPYFPQAGRSISVLEGTRRQLICDDKGVPLIEAFAHADLDYVLRDSHPAFLATLQGHSVVGLDPTKAKADMGPEGLPSFFVKVTRFKCGGLTLGVTFNHSLTDGKGFFDFMRAWSDIAIKGKTCILPCHERSLANAYEKLLYPSFSNVKLPQRMEPWAIKSLQVNMSTINLMKMDVKKESNKDGAYVSKLDCIGAQTLRSLSRLPSEITGVDEIAVLTVVEGRSKFYNPPLPEYYFGNVITSMRLPKISTSELLDRPSTFAAQKIREKIISTRCETWISAERIAEVREIAMNQRIARWGMTSWLSFPVNEVDFGLGKPFFVRGFNSEATLEGFLGFCWIVPPNPTLSHLSVATIQFTSTPKVLEALQSDPEFSSFFLDI